MGVRSADWPCERHGQSTPCQIRFPRGSKRSSRLRPRPEPCRERTVERHWYLQSSASFCRRVRRHRTRYSQATRLEVQRMRYDLELRLPSLFALTYFYPFLNSMWFPRSQFLLNVTRTVEQVPPAGQPQMEGVLGCPAEREGDTTLEGVEGNSEALKYRDASCRKGGHRSIERQVPELS